VGGIIDQIPEGTGILLPDPTDLQTFGRAVRLLLADQGEATRLGLAAHAYVRDHYLGDIHLLRYASLLTSLVSKHCSPARGRELAAPPIVLTPSVAGLRRARQRSAAGPVGGWLEIGGGG